MELRHLRYFVAVAEEHSFTRAAERLGIQQPPLSLQIRKLETELGTPLFRRLTRRVELTGAGKLLLEEARNILERVERTKIDVKRRARGETGQICIGTAAATYFDPLVPLVTREFCAKYPDIVMYAEESGTRMLMANVHAGKIDAAFVWSPIADHSDLAVIPVSRESWTIVLPEGHPLDRPPAIPLAALAKEKFYLFPRRSNAPMFDAIMAACGRAGFQPMLGRELPHIFAALPIVAAGLGISLVPQCVSRVRVDGVSFRPIEGEPLSVQVSLIHRRNDKSAAVKNLVSIVRRIAQPGAPSRSTAQSAVA